MRRDDFAAQIGVGKKALITFYQPCGYKLRRILYHSDAYVGAGFTGAYTDMEDANTVVTAALTVIGDEVLSGRTKDTHIGTIADHLTSIGIRLMEVRVIADDEAAIIEAVNGLRGRYDYVFTTGGIGPTHDDITADAVANAFGVQLRVDERAVAMMRERYGESGLTPMRLRMARIPEGAGLIENPISKAPGFVIGNVIVMAGVPNIMRAMLELVTPQLRTGRVMLTDVIELKVAESLAADVLRNAQETYPDVKMGSYPYYVAGGGFGTSLVLRSVDAERLAAAKGYLLEGLRRVGVMV
jgi:molybdenum cofactor synthesis domain-containing protein